MLHDAGSYITNTNHTRMMFNIDKQDNEQSKLETLSNSLYSKLSDDNYSEIEQLIRTSFGWENIDPDHVINALKLICDYEAEHRIKESKRIRR